MPRPLALAVLALLAGCGDRAAETLPPEPPEATTEAAPPREIVRARCAAGAANCAAATGRIIYLESVDPDGDGDLHLVIAGGSVTAPGISVLDIERDRRPKRDPRVGDLASAAGPVYTGSYGQRQIEATELHLLRRR